MFKIKTSSEVKRDRAKVGPRANSVTDKEPVESDTFARTLVAGSGLDTTFAGPMVDLSPLTFSQNSLASSPWSRISRPNYRKQ